MSNEAELPGEKVNFEQLQMICCRYYIAAGYVAGKRVLEAGCGAGLGLGYLAETAREVVAGDISAENVELARQHYGDRIKLMTLDARELPFPNSSFDVIISMEVIHYLELEKFLDEARRVLKKDGRLLVCIPNRDAPGFQPSRMSRHYYPVPELAEKLQQHRFSAEIYGAFPIHHSSTRASLRGKLIIAVSRLLDITPRGDALRETLNRRIIGRNIVIKPELAADDMAPEYLRLAPIDPGVADRHYRLIYAIASPA